jgi:acyl dehydratase
MSDSFSAEDWRVLPLRGFDELRIGEMFKSASRTMTEANFAAFQTVSLDNHPIHYDDEYCNVSATRVLSPMGFRC